MERIEQPITSVKTLIRTLGNPYKVPGRVVLDTMRLLTVKIHTQNERPTRVMKILVSVKGYVARAFLIILPKAKGFGGTWLHYQGRRSQVYHLLAPK